MSINRPISRLPESKRKAGHTTFNAKIGSRNDWLTPMRSQLGEGMFSLASEPGYDGKSIIDKAIDDTITEVSKWFPVRTPTILMDEEMVSGTVIHKDYSDVEIITEYQLPNLNKQGAQYTGSAATSSVSIPNMRSPTGRSILFTYHFMAPDRIVLDGNGPRKGINFRWFIEPLRTIATNAEIHPVVDAEVDYLLLRTVQEYLFNNYYEVADSDFAMGLKNKINEYANAGQEKLELMGPEGMIAKKSVRHSAHMFTLLRS